MREITKYIGAGFHPDTPAGDYINLDTREPLFTAEQAIQIDENLAEAFSLLEARGRDPYDIAIKVQRRILGFSIPTHEMRPMAP